MLEIARRTYDRRALAGSYLSHGKSDLREQAKLKEVEEERAALATRPPSAPAKRSTRREISRG